MLEYRVLGGLSVVDGDDELTVGGARQRRLVAMLLVHRNSVVSVDRLAEVVFAGDPTPGAATTLRSYVARLRRVVQRPGSGSRVVTQAPGYKLEVADQAFDAARVETALVRARTLLVRDEAVSAAEVLRGALVLWRGAPYAEFADEEWARGEAHRLEELHLVVHEALADAELATGRAAEATSLLEGLVAEHPLRESLQSRMMLALYRGGRHVDALRSYQAHREVLGAELGLEPSPELVRLEARILAHDESLYDPPADTGTLRGYRLGERLGTGRDGTVYAARLPGVDRDIAIRVIPEDVANDVDFVRTFSPDARRVASLRHDAIVPIHDWWREPGAAYVVMRRLRGGTLRDRLQSAPVGHEAAAALVERLGAALVAAAGAGIVHGRVVPESVFFDEAGTCFLGDFPLGTCSRASPAGDVADLVELAAHAVTGARPASWRADGVPPGLADAWGAVTALPAAATPDELASVVVATVAALEAKPTTTRPTPVVTNPYKGLRAFDEPDADDFFGRDRLVDEVLARLTGGEGTGRERRGNVTAGRLVLVVGGSGSGKSSIVRAGLLPRVRRGAVPGSASWFVATMVPGKAPFEELAEALREVSVLDVVDLPSDLAAERGLHEVVQRLVPAGGELLLVVDQLEELFTLAPEHDQRAFLEGLTHATSTAGSRLRVVATLRADFYDRPLRFEGFAGAVGDATVPVGAMSPAELEAAIVGPAERVGATVEPALIAELVGAVVHEPAALPALQFTLTELAERCPHGCLTLAAYEELGGVDGAIAERAEALYCTLAPDSRRGVRGMFDQLVVVGSEGTPTRRRALTTDLANVTEDGTVEMWTQARLLTLDRHPDSRAPTVEVAHEALLQAWPRLRDWMAEDREQIVTLGHLREAAADWESLARDPGALYRGARLESTLAVAEARRSSLPTAERDFLDASTAARDRERKAVADRARHAIRTNRRLRIQLAAVGAALVVALVVGAIAVGQRNRAEDQGRLAEVRELAAAANANLDVDPERSVLLALAAVERSSDGGASALPEAEEALHRAVTASRIERRVPDVGVLDWSPKGDTFAAMHPFDDDDTVEIHDARTGELELTLDGHEGDVIDGAYSSDGSLLATTGRDGALRVWDPATGDEVLTVEGSGEVWAPTFDRDRALVAAAWTGEGVARVIDVATGRTVREIRSIPFPTGASFDPAGERIAIASGTTPVAKVVAVDTGEALFGLEGHLHWVSDVTWSPDGASIATAGADGSARIWDAATGAQRYALLGHEAHISNVVWSPGSRHVATASNDGTAKVWGLTEGGPRLLFTLSAQEMQEGVLGVAFSPDGSSLMTGDVGADATRVWDVSVAGDAEVANLPGVAFHYGAAAYTPDGDQLVAGSPGESVTVWEVATGRPVRTLGGGPEPEPEGVFEPVLPAPSEIGSVMVSPDGRSVLATTFADGAFYRGSGDDTVRIWDLASGREALELQPGGEVVGAAWSPDSELLALALAVPGQTDHIVVVDRSGEPVTRFDAEAPAGFGEMAFSKDGRRLIVPRIALTTADTDTHGVDIWDWRRGAVVDTIDTPRGYAVIDPTGAHVAVLVAASNPDDTDDAEAEIWDVATARRVATLPGGSGDVAFSADGSTVVTGANDGIVRVWDVEAGRERTALQGHLGAISDVALTADGRQAASVGADGTVRVWALRLDDLVAIAEGGLTRDLTGAECRRYLHLDRCPDG